MSVTEWEISKIQLRCETQAAVCRRWGKGKCDGSKGKQKVRRFLVVTFIKAMVLTLLLGGWAGALFNYTGLPFVDITRLWLSRRPVQPPCSGLVSYG